MDYKKMREDMAIFYASEEGQKAIAEFRDKIKKETIFNERWVDKTVRFLEGVSDEELELLCQSFSRHNEKQKGESMLSNFILKAFEQLGEDYEVEDGMFTAAAYQYKGYVAELCIGQGSFISIYKI